jgi:hypothetical protein
VSLENISQLVMTKRTTPYSICYNKFDVQHLKTQERLSRINFISKGKVVIGRLKRGRPAGLDKQDYNNNKENRNSNLSSFSLSLGGMDSISASYAQNDVAQNDETNQSSPSPMFTNFGSLHSTSKQQDPNNIPDSTKHQAVPIDKVASDNTNFVQILNFNNDDSEDEDKNKKIGRKDNDPTTVITQPESEDHQEGEGEGEGDLLNRYIHYASYKYNYNISF